MYSHNILLVDNEANNLKALERILKRKHKVFSATNIANTLAIMEREHIALVMINEYIDGMRYVEFLGTTLKGYPDVIRIVLTASANQELFSDDETNVYRFISKPWEPEEIRNVVREGIETYEFSRASREPYVWALLHSEVISANQLTVALRAQRNEQKSIAEILLEHDMISTEQLDIALESNESQRKPLVEILLEQEAISQDDLNTALSIQERQKKTLPEVLSDLGYASEEDIFSCYALQLGMPYLSLSQFASRPAMFELLSADLAYKHTLVPIDSIGAVLVVAAPGPLSIATKRELEAETGYKVMAVCASHKDIETALYQSYAGKMSAVK